MEQTATEVTKKKNGILSNPIFRNIGVVVVAIIVAGVLVYWHSASSTVSITNSTVSASQIDISPSAAGVLKAVYVNEGDEILANTVVAQVGDELLKSQIAGLVTTVNKQIGTTFNPGQAVVSMIDPTQLRIVGQLEENKGLDKIKVGQPATFTVDTFGSKTYQGIVDEVSPTAESSSVVFNISDQRQTQIFDIKVRFNPDQYPELKNGMSAKITVYTK
jgi:multidrug resistance efflux pump